MGWLERVPSYKDQQEKLKEKDLATYGFLGYPLLQSADILIYKAGLVPVGEDQVAHVEMTREIARRFNHVYGREPDFAAQAEAGRPQDGQEERQALRQAAARLSGAGRSRGPGRWPAPWWRARATSPSATASACSATSRAAGASSCPSPRPLLTKASKMPGLDGQKMSKSYNNTIALRDDPAKVEKALRTMPTDPARVRRTDPGEPEKCPVWQFHQVYSDDSVRDWVQQGCRTAGIGCLDCKQPVIDAVLAELAPIQERAREYEAQPELLRNVINDGCEAAREVARETMDEVRRAMSLVQS